MVAFIYICSFLVAIFVLFLVHELGHFLCARLFNIKVKRFSIGFGKPFYTWKGKKSGTEFVLAPIFLGGYVKLLNTREFKLLPPYDSQAFNDKSVLTRLVVVASGPFANLVFALFAFWIMFFIGFKLPKPIIGGVVPGSIASMSSMQSGEEIIKVDGVAAETWSNVAIAMLSRIENSGHMTISAKFPLDNKVNKYKFDLKKWKLDPYSPNPLTDFGIIRYKPSVLPVVHRIKRNSPAEKYGLSAGDLVVGVEGNKVHDWNDFIDKVKHYPEKKIKISIERKAQPLDLLVDIDWKFDGKKKVGFLGASVDSEKIVWPYGALREHKYGLWQSLGAAANQIEMFFELNSIIFGKMLLGKVSFGIIGGPFGTFLASGQALEQGFVMFMGFLGMFSLGIAMLNFLPLPGLDGGQFVLILLEGVTRRQISPRMHILIFRLGIAFFVFLVLRATVNDLIRFFS